MVEEKIVSLEKLIERNKVLDIGNLSKEDANKIFDYFNKNYFASKGRDQYNKGKYAVVLGHFGGKNA